MNYEEKYNGALKSMRDLYNKMKYLSSTDALAIAVTLEKAFPELKESEDERIRKWLINLLSKMQYHHCDDEMEMGNKAITWLEKQGAHKKFRDSIQVGDKVTRNEDGELVNLSQLNRVAKKQGEQKQRRISCVQC